MTGTSRAASYLSDPGRRANRTVSSVRRHFRKPTRKACSKRGRFARFAHTKAELHRLA